MVSSKKKKISMSNKKLLIINYRLLIVFLLLLPSLVFAQQLNDTLNAMRQFVQVSNAYKHVPMYAGVELRNSSNFPGSTADTATIEAEFYLTTNEVYMKFGEMEQIINDSL